MGPEPIGAALEKEGPLSFPNMHDRAARGGLHLDRVHPVHLFGRHAIGLRLAVDVGFDLRVLQRHAHRVEIVFADEQQRQLPDAGQVHGFVERAFPDRALAEETGGDRARAQTLVGQRDAGRQRQAASDDRVAAEETPRAIEDVHRAAAAAAAAFELAHHLGHQRTHGHTPCQRLPVVAVGGHDGVTRLQRSHDTDRDRFLPVVEVQEAADLLRLVELDALGLEAANAQHLPVQVLQVRTVEMDLFAHFSSLSRVDRSPSGRPSSRALSSRRMILPLRVLGRLARKSISLGATAAPSRLRAWPSNSRRSASPGSKPGLERDEGLDHLAHHRVGLADHAGLGDGGVLHQRAFHLERADQVAGRLDDVVGAADEPEVAFGVAPGQVAGEIPAAGEALAVALVLMQVAAHHRRPRRLERQFAVDHGFLDHLHAAALGAPHDRRRRCRAAACPSSPA